MRGSNPARLTIIKGSNGFKTQEVKMAETITTLSKLANELLKNEIIKFNAFSSDTPPFRAEWAGIYHHPAVLNMLLEILRQEVGNFKTGHQLLTGASAVVWPLALDLAEQVHINFVRPIKIQSNQTNSPSLRGRHNPGQKALVVNTEVNDDLPATIRVLEANNLRVDNILVLLDYGKENGLALKLKSNYHLRALFSLPQLLDLFLQNGRIGRPTYDAVISWLKK